MFCRNCGAQADEGAQFCIRCGANLREEGASAPGSPPPAEPLGGAGQTTPPPPPPLVTTQKQKIVAALLGFLLGWLGIHRFYLGFHVVGAIQLLLGVLGIFSCGITTAAAWIWGIADAIMILNGSIRTDAQGVPLRD